ncbi:MAG: nitrogenase iron-molybdenum cofactor biosynthesis protein NifN [Burkholderiales bacterium]|nr:nitrogenase iron-molybdenum cofactor biosynthesis protein NifN [Burkholderiales bacterium]
MAKVVSSRKSCSVNPLKMSQPIGGALAFMGIANAMPVLHGSQGCTAFGLVLFVRHFREAIPLQTTAMNEVSTILGGMENIEEALLNIHARAKPELIGLCTTGLTETRGEDIMGELKLIRSRHPELQELPIVFVETPDYKDSFQDGWANTVARIVCELVDKPRFPIPGQVNLLAGSHLTAADIEEIVDTIEAFGLKAVVLPDLSGSLDGHIPQDFSPTTIGGTKVREIRSMGGSLATIAIGRQMEKAAIELESRSGVSYTVFDRLTGLEENDRFLMHLSGLSGQPVPEKLRRRRSQLVDAMLDSHFHFGGKKIAIAAEPDLLWAIGALFAEMGAKISVAVTTTRSPLLERMPCEEVLIGDLEDLETRAGDSDLILTHSHGRQASRRLGIPLMRIGLPTFDRLGASHALNVGYRGSMKLIFQAANLLLEREDEDCKKPWGNGAAAAQIV